jgi:HAE1 family hydrophobic/amphiphilic exporter-1
MILSEIAVRRPVFTTMVMSALIVFGWVSFTRLGVDLFPKVDFPVISIVTRLPGADPETVESRLSDPIEEAVNTLSGIKHLRSTSADSYSLVTIEFQLEKNIDTAFQEVQARVRSIRTQLPTDAEEPVIEKLDVDAAPILTLVVAGDLSPRELTHLADKVIKERLQRVRDVGSVRLVGARDRKIWLWLDPEKMTSHGLTVQDVRNALQREHVELPGGRVETGPLELVVKTKAEFQTAAAMNDLVIVQHGNSTVRLQDVGYAEDGIEELRSYAQLNDQPGIALQVRRQSGTNTVRVAHDVKAEALRIQMEYLAEVAKAAGPVASAPPAIQDILQRVSAGPLTRDDEVALKAYLQSVPNAPRPRAQLVLAQDMSTFIERSVDEVKFHLLEGGGLAVLTVLLFLLSFRSTFISALVLPTSVISTFMMMSAMGFTVNMMTLLGLTLAIGLLIDDSIVVQENTMRHVEEGKPSREAALFATSEIGLAVFATTMSVVAVFIPVAFTEGVVGRFFFSFAITVAFAVLISMFVSFTLDPMLSSRILRKPKLNIVFRGLEWSYEQIEAAYGKILALSLRVRFVVILFAIGIFAVTLALRGYLHFEFVPMEDQAEFNVMVRAPLGASLERTRESMEKLIRPLREVPEVSYTFYSIGSDELRKNNEGQIYVRLKEKRERKRSQGELMTLVRQKLKEFTDARTSVQMVPHISGGGMKWAEVQYELRGQDFATLNGVAATILERLRQSGGYVDLDTTYETGKPELDVVLDRARSSERGVSPLAVGDTVRAAIGGVDIGKFRAEGDRYDIAVRFLERFRDRPEMLETLLVPSTLGTPQELRAVAQVVRTAIPVEINRHNRQRQITVLANLQGGKKLGDATDEIERITREIGLPSGYTSGWAGFGEEMKTAIPNLLFTMLLSVIVTYMVLTAQFESLVHPFTIMLSLPLAFTGALGALILTGMTVSIFSMIAFIFLLGLVTKNAILLIDYTNTLRRRDGMERDEALRRAGPVRLRPILMTSCAMIFGMLPVALGAGSGAESRQPMAVAIIGGLVSSTLLTLLVVPAVYSLFDQATTWLWKFLGQTPDADS